jgi:hypothetical protein
MDSGLVRADGVAMPSLAGHGGCHGSWFPEPTWKHVASALACLLRLSLLLPLDGRDGEGRRSWELVLEAELRRWRDSNKLKLWQIPSDGEERRRYPWPRRPPHTSRVLALRSCIFPQAVAPTRRIFDLDTTTYPDGGPSGAVPGVTASGHGVRSSQSSGGDEGPDRFSVSYLGSFT